MKNNFTRSPKIVIIGAGMSGLLLFIKLREAGISDVTIFEKKENLGGTWRDNTYPGVACDVPAHLYTYSFEPNPEWSKRFAEGHEIQAYFERVGRKYSITEHIHFNEEVTDAIFRDGRWHISTSQHQAIEADFLISATGILRQPNTPTIKGLESFAGDIFHSAEWNHNAELKDKRIGIIGTGSSAAQITTALANQGYNLSVFQRTPQWILSYPNREFSEAEREACRENVLRPLFFSKLQGFLIEQIGSKAVIGNRFQHGLVSLACKWNLRASIKNPDLRKKLTPDYKVGCKRLILSDGYYDAVQRSNVSLVTEGIEYVVPTGIFTSNGNHHPLDAIILATGFDPFAYMRPLNLVGKQGIHINDAWKNKVQAYCSINLPDFPNFFLMLGPNSPIGNFSVIAISEVQTHYLLQIIKLWQTRMFDEISAKHQSMHAYNRYIKHGMKKTVWVSGCNSWYLDQDGDPAMWPYTWAQWRKEMARPNLSDFDMICHAMPDMPSTPSKKLPVHEPG